MAGLAFAMIEGMDRWVDEIMTDVGCNLELQAEQKHEAANATHDTGSVTLQTQPRAINPCERRTRPHLWQ